jgi:hypothetical protein
MRPAFPWWPYLIVLALIMIGAMLPIGLTVYAANVAQGLGCTVTNGVLDPCVVEGVDRAPELQMMASSFVYALFTWPAGILAACIWFGVLYWHRTRWKKRVGLG